MKFWGLGQSFFVERQEQVGTPQALRRVFSSEVTVWTTSWPIRLIDSKMTVAQTTLTLFCGFQKELPLPLPYTVSIAGSNKQKISLQSWALFVFAPALAAVTHAPVNGTNEVSNGGA